MAGSQPSSPFPLGRSRFLDGFHWKLWGGSGLPFLGATPQGRERPGRRGLSRRRGALAAGSPGPRGVERPLWLRFLGCVQPGWPPPGGLDVFLGNLVLWGYIAGSALANFSEGPQRAQGGQRPGCAGAQGCREAERGPGRLSF